MSAPANRIDLTTLSVIHNHLVNICREMGTAMMQTSYSPIFNEGLDFSCVLFNREGEMIAQAEFCPAQLGAILYTVRWTIAELGLESFEEGDVVIHNDPYRGGCHMPEHMVLKPIFYDGALFGFAANIGHVAEIGGMAPGSFAATATEVFQEGLRLPLVKIMRRGEYVRDLWKLVLANHRTPRSTWGDFHAMIGSLHIAEQRVHRLLEKYGVPFINDACRELMDHAERWMREEIRHIPDGEYAFEDVMEDDGATENPTWFRVTMVVRGDEIIADWSRSDPQARGIVNATFGVTASATYNAIFHVTDKNIPHNSGCYRPIKIIAPPGSCVNVRYPGPSVAGNTESHPRMVDLILGALAQAVPDRVAAAEGGTSCNFLFGGVHPETGQYYANYHFEGGGWGGRAFADGNNALIVPNGNCRNTPVEVFETRYPFLTHSYKLVADSAGPGTYRGGLGTQRIIEVLPPAEITISAVFERMRVSPWGLFEGGHANNSAILVKKRGDPTFRTFKEVYHTVSPAKFVNCVVSPGDQILLQAPGGGGYGHPYKRPVELVVRDVNQRFISPEAGRVLYGVSVRRTNGHYELDAEGTAALRAGTRQTDAPASGRA
ncbi:MAG TPA: hydantoinase B/oxoprolinase family protein [bacterium]